MPRHSGIQFRTGFYMVEVTKHSHGIFNDRKRLRWIEPRQVPDPCPPTGEQVPIAHRIDQEMTSTDDLADRIDQQVEQSNKYLTRPIADVFNGELDFRKAGAQLPDEAGDVESLAMSHALSHARAGTVDTLNTGAEAPTT